MLNVRFFGWPITKFELHKKEPKKLELQKNEPSKLEPEKKIFSISGISKWVLQVWKF